MIPEAEVTNQSLERTADYPDMEKDKEKEESEVPVITAWKMYQQVVAAMESAGRSYNRTTMLEAMFRGNNLVYAKQ
ncbi:uncharacterized protein LOC105696681 [Orussus abietinus]|uniref:uncharacterized protein LOC105696681 n=1 Tax=Orussus abietinus TaxID=222816 RepID=UPI000626B9EB|nr:uncharacterized protein LOC105696681 [Orussus abietinus]